MTAETIDFNALIGWIVAVMGWLASSGIGIKYLKKDSMLKSIIDLFQPDSTTISADPSLDSVNQIYRLTSTAREWILSDLPIAEQATVNNVIDANEANRIAYYTLPTSKGTFEIYGGGVNKFTPSNVVVPEVQTFYKMTDTTKEWVTYGHDADVRASLRQQIADAEADKQNHYRIFFPEGYYDIHNGFYKGDGTPNFPNDRTSYQSIGA